MRAPINDPNGLVKGSNPSTCTQSSQHPWTQKRDPAGPCWSSRRRKGTSYREVYQSMSGEAK